MLENSIVINSIKDTYLCFFFACKEALFLKEISEKQPSSLS